MAGLINELIDILEKQSVNYDELLVLSHEKKKVIIKNDVEMLQKITQAENSIVGRNQRMENKRIEIMKSIADVLNQDVSELTLGVLAELISNQEEYPRLLEIRLKLKNVLSGLKDINDQNSRLLESSLEYIDFTVNLVRSACENESYVKKGKGAISGDTGFFDAKR